MLEMALPPNFVPCLATRQSPFVTDHRIPVT